MKLERIARKYDTCPAFDGYSGAPLFRVQASTFLESAVEGSTSSRRVISLAPELVPPTHSVVLLMGELWLLGAANPDEWNGSVIRRAYWAKKVTDNFRLLTPAAAVLGLAGTTLFGQKKFLRETINTNTDAELDGMWDISFSASVNTLRGYFVRSGTTLYRIRLEYKDTDGFLTCQCDQLDEAPVSATFTAGERFDPVADKYVSTLVTTQVLTVDYSKLYTKQQQTDYQFVAGDICVIVPRANAIPVEGMKLSLHAPSLFEGTWQVLNIRGEHDAYALHMRRT